MARRSQGRPDLLALARTVRAEYADSELASVLREPLVIVSAPRAGSNLLFEQLSRFPGIWTIGGESHGVYRVFPKLRAQNPEFDSGRLDESHADPETCADLRACLLALLRDHRGEPYLQLPAGDRAPHVTFLEKTPRNALNLPFLLALFPDARFIFLHRDPRQNVASLVEAWDVGLRTGRFVTFRGLPGWDRSAWCFLLPPGWHSMRGRSLVEIAAFQWAETNRILLEDLGRLDRQRWFAVGYDALVARPGETLAAVAGFAGIPAAASILEQQVLPLSRTTLSAPDPDKWRRHETEINAVLPQLAAIERAIEAAVLRA
jgi:Sulfotransferase family